MSKRDAAATKARILESAKTIFSEIGFDAARMDDIVEKAGVNKALIYYYFKSKDQLLERVYEEFLAKAKAHFKEIVDNPHKLFDDTTITAYFESSLAFLEENEDLLRIIMMESLKKNVVSPLIFRGLDAWNERHVMDILDKFRDAGVNIEKSMSHLMVSEFFTNSMPVIMFVLLNQHWEKRYNIGAAELRAQFIAAMRATHVHHHRHQPGDPKRGRQ